jgi:hypothetical protein
MRLNIDLGVFSRVQGKVGTGTSKYFSTFSENGAGTSRKKEGSEFGFEHLCENPCTQNFI